MIVIPTYNGYWPLSQLLKSLKEFGTDNHKVLVVDNNSNDLISKKYLQEIASEDFPFELLIEKNINGSYESSAMLHAVRNHQEDKFILIHDSCIATSDQWLKQFENKLTPEVGVVNWIKFRPCLFACYPPHLAYMKTICSYEDVPDGGFFGSIFMAHGDILREFDAKGYLRPLTSKIEAEAWERIWPILFHINGHSIECIIDGFNPSAIHYGGYPHLRKSFVGRQ